jgi:protein-tyrosine kinase
MSKNFQLLEQLDQERLRDASEYRAEEDLAAPTTPKPNRGARTYEELNGLVQRLFFNGSTSVRQVVFAGASPRVGCTWICTHAAEILCSQTDRDVCLVDTNRGSPGISEYFNIPNGPGFHDVLADDTSMQRATWKVANNLWVMPAGSNLDGETVGPSDGFDAQLSELGRQFDFVLFDAAPVAANSSSIAIATLADGAVLVLRAGHTPRRVVRHALKELATAHAKVLGTVLNQRDYPVPRAIYQRLQ